MYGFTQAIVVYRAEGENVCYVEDLEGATFQQVLDGIKDQTLHNVLVREAPTTLFIVNATVDQVNNWHNVT